MMLTLSMSPGRAQNAGSERPVAPHWNVAPEKNEAQPADGNAANAESAAGRVQSPSAARSLERNFVPNLLADQKAFWTRPLHPKADDVNWLFPFGAAASLMIGSDRSIEARVPVNGNRIRRSQQLSNAGAAALAGTAGSFYFWGKLAHDDHARETGFLSAEALVNSLAIGSVLQLAAGRERPSQAEGVGRFWHGGTSFPSNHAAAAWSLASVLAQEYPGTMTRLVAYGTASAVSMARVTGRKHFAADAFIGSALGWYLGRETYRAHHDPDSGGPGWEAPPPRENEPRRPANMGSPYVPLDSWIYPALTRLAALGYAPDASLGMRPWTRMECARLVREVADSLEQASTAGNEADEILSALKTEFSGENARWEESTDNRGASLDSIYARFAGISGPPLRDSYHFGQSIINDSGRPYGEGFGMIEGFTSHAVAGPFAIAVQGEFQHSPALASDPAGVLAATAAADGTLPVANGRAEINRFRLVESAVSLTFSNVQFSFGQQGLWLGPGESGSFLFSNNAEPIPMLRIDSVSPYRVPFLSEILGTVRSQFFLGRLSGQRWEASPTLFGPSLCSQPFVHGGSVSFHPTPNLEFGFGYTAQFGGQGNPFTWSSFLRTFYSHRSDPTKNPAKRLSEFNFRYRVPGMRDWLQVYLDSMVIDEYSPIGSARPAINPGVYFPRLPKLPRMDLRLEGITTDLNWPSHFSPGAFYADGRYRSGYTNNGNLLGSWIGRQGRGQQGWLTYRFSARTFVETGYRHNSVDHAFLGGGNLEVFSLRANFALSREWGVSTFVQHEKWRFPALAPAAKSDNAAVVEMTFWPRKRPAEGHDPRAGGIPTVND